MLWEKLGFSRETEIEGDRVNVEDEVEQGEGTQNFPVNETSGNNYGYEYNTTATNDDVENRKDDEYLSTTETVGFGRDCGCLKAIIGGGVKESSQQEQTDTSDTAPIKIPKEEQRMAGNMLMRANGIFVVMIAACQTFAGLQVHSSSSNFHQPLFLFLFCN